MKLEWFGCRDWMGRVELSVGVRGPGGLGVSCCSGVWLRVRLWISDGTGLLVAKGLSAGVVHGVTVKGMAINGRIFMTG